MSVAVAGAAAASQAWSTPLAVADSQQGQADLTATAAAESVSQPAVIVTLSSNTTASAQTAPTDLGSLDPTMVSDALFQASGANGFAANYERGDWGVVAKKFGEAIADRDIARARNAAAFFGSNASSSASNLGIPIKDSVSPSTVSNGAKPGVITVAAFTFTNDGSTYSVTPGANGTLVGTKDGQAWQTWQLLSPDQQTGGDSANAGALQALRH